MENYFNEAERMREDVIALVENPREVTEDELMLRVKRANEWNANALQRPDPRSLWFRLWYEGEVCCLFADSNIGKSIYAVQIAAELSKHDKVLYFDFEMSDKQFQLRYTDEEGRLYLFPDNFYRSEICAENINGETFEDDIIEEIEQAVTEYGIRIIIIDNLTYLCSESERGDAASRLMMNLLQLKRRHDLSILVLAHTPKRSLSSPITQNDLAGSKKLFNFFDSCFAMGKSAKDGNLRYVKQLKSRASTIEYGMNNVMVTELVKDGGYLHFDTVGYDHEKTHLKEPEEGDCDRLKVQIKNLREMGKSVRQIAAELSVSKSKVSRILNS